MAKEVKVGVHRGAGAPPFRWNGLVLELAYKEAISFLDESQYLHLAHQVQELAREVDPTHSKTQSVSQVQVFYELRDKGGPLGRLNVRVFL